MDNYSEKIQDYIEGQLIGEDLVEFEARLIVDDELRNLLSLQREVHNILAYRVVSKEVELRETLKSVSNNFRHQTNHKIVDFKKWIPILVAACLLIVGTLFFFNQSDELYDLPIMNSEIVRGQEDNITYESAVKAFNAKDYLSASKELEYLVDSNPNLIQYKYYLGLTYLGNNNFNSAILILSPIAEGESVFSEEAKYYLAVAYHKNGDNSAAEEILKQISLNSSLKEKANKLIIKIK